MYASAERDVEEESSEMNRVTLVGAGCNLALSGIKAAGGIIGGSTVLVADAVHSLTDLLSDGVTLVATKLGRREADKDHPYGHGKIEAIGSLAIGSIVLFSGIGMGIHSVETLLELAIHHTATPSSEQCTSNAQYCAGAAAVASILVKEYLYRWTFRLGKQLRSPVLIANAVHHRSDAFSSWVACIGVIGSAYGASLLDPLAATLVSAMICKVGGEILYDSICELSDRIDNETLTAIAEVAQNIDGVNRVEHVRARRSGPNLLVDLSIIVSDRKSFSSAHWSAENVEEAVSKAFDNVSDVVVHIEPFSKETEFSSMTSDVRRKHLLKARCEREIRNDVADAALGTKGVEGVSPVAVHYRDMGIFVDVNIYVNSDVQVSEAHAISRDARTKILSDVRDVLDVDMHLELDSRRYPSEKRPGLEETHPHYPNLLNYYRKYG
jgi:cation diffusion facilitator family transporter